MIFNVHLLSHIPEYVKQLGALDDFSAFDFENYFGLIKRRVRPTKEIFKSVLTKVNNLSQTEVPVTRKAVYSSKSPNNICVLPDESIGLITKCHTVKDTFLVNGYKLRLATDLYTTPYPSRLLKIGHYSLTRIAFEHLKPVKKCISYLKCESSDYLVFPYVQ